MNIIQPPERLIKPARLSLTDELRLHHMKGKHFPFPMFQGEVEITVRNPDGSVATHAKKKNLATRELHEHCTYHDDGMDNWRIVISNDQYDYNFHKSVMLSSLSGGSYASASKSNNSTTETWEFRAAWTTPPPSDRIFYWVGVVGKGDMCRQNGQLDMLAVVICGTKLSSGILQTNVQTLEIVYRLSWIRVS